MERFVSAHWTFFFPDITGTFRFRKHFSKFAVPHPGLNCFCRHVRFFKIRRECTFKPYLKFQQQWRALIWKLHSAALTDFSLSYWMSFGVENECCISEGGFNHSDACASVAPIDIMQRVSKSSLQLKGKENNHFLHFFNHLPSKQFVMQDLL